MGLGAEGRRPSEASVNLKLEAIIKLNADLCHTFCEHHNFIRISLLYFEKKEVMIMVDSCKLVFGGMYIFQRSFSTLSSPFQSAF